MIFKKRPKAKKLGNNFNDLVANKSLKRRRLLLKSKIASGINAVAISFKSINQQKLKDVFQKTARRLPEFKKRSSVHSRGVSSYLKYLIFVLEPHWQYFKDGSKISICWAGQSTKRLWQSKKGKIIIVQTTVIVLLFSIIAWQSKAALPKAARIQAKDGVAEKVILDDQLGIRQYLPTAKDYIAPKPFQPITALSEKIPISAWIAPWNLDDQKVNLDKYTSISAFWLTLAEDGSTINQRTNLKPFLEIINSLGQNKPELLLSITGNPNYVYKALVDSTIQDQLINNLLEEILKSKAQGIDIDFEALGEENRDLFTIFIKNLSEKFHQADKVVSVTLEARIVEPPMDWSALAQSADRLTVMLYDYHARNTGYPGPVAPIGWVADQMHRATSQIPKGKFIIALPNYGYDWEEVKNSESEYQYEGIGISFENALALAEEKNAQIFRARNNDPRGFDIGDVPYFVYTDSEGDRHSVWFEDARSLSNKINFISKFNPKSIMFWHAGLGDTQLWQAILEKKQNEEIKKQAENEKALEILQEDELKE